MKTKTRCLLSLLNFCVLTLLACGNSDGAGEDSGVPYLAKKGEPVDGVRIGWDYGTIRQLATRGGYPRSIRLQDNTVVAVYENYDTGYEMRRSTDEGSTWGDPVILFPIHSITNDKGTARINIANSEIIQLANGDLLAACNYRPQTPEITPFAIAVRRSTDNGVTWSDPQIIYEAEPRFSDGCWEPFFLQLPNGEVQVYFANEGPYTHSNEQEISMMTSVDNGKTWGGYKTVCFRAGSRDGMPVSKVVGDEIVCVIEDCGFVTFKPYTVRTKLSDNWSSPVLADSPNRAMALGEPVEDWIYMGAPYLGVLPTGETLLSYQVDDIRHDDQLGDRLPYSTMEVAIGDKNARNFVRCTRPFPVPAGKHAVWPSVAVWDANTIAALATSNYQGGTEAPFFMKGHVMRDLEVNSSDIVNYPIFIGHTGICNLRLGVGKDADNLYITCKVKDGELYSGGQGTQKGSGVFIYLDTKNECLKEPAEGVYKVWCSYKGDITVWQGNKGKWENSELEGLQITPSVVPGGYELAFTIPLNRSFNKDTMRLCATLSTKTYTETLVHSNADWSCTWMKMNLGGH